MASLKKKTRIYKKKKKKKNTDRPIEKNIHTIDVRWRYRPILQNSHIVSQIQLNLYEKYNV